MGPEWETHPCAERAPGAGQLAELGSTQLHPWAHYCHCSPKPIFVPLGVHTWFTALTGLFTDLPTSGALCAANPGQWEMLGLLRKQNTK